MTKPWITPGMIIQWPNPERILKTASAARRVEITLTVISVNKDHMGKNSFLQIAGITSNGDIDNQVVDVDPDMSYWYIIYDCN